jgi:hypothetical protein
VTRNTAVAIVLGIDPDTYLSAKGLKQRVLVSAMKEAAEIMDRRRKNEIEAIGAACARALARMIKKR